MQLTTRVKLFLKQNSPKPVFDTNAEEFISEFQAGLRSQTNILALPL